MSTDRFLRTGEVASRLGVSRQHVVDMCTQGQLPFVMVGAHRRIPAEAVTALTKGGRRHDDGHSQSSALHAAVVSKLIQDPERVLGIARENVRRDYELGARHSVAYTREWESVLDEGVVAVIDTLLDQSEHGATLRSCTPFTGVLDDDEVRAVKRVYRVHAK
ncbi:excisionase family DNA-binding protein [Mycolicibacterium sp. Y3]